MDTFLTNNLSTYGDGRKWTGMAGNWPGRRGTHSADRKPNRDVAEHTLPTENWPGTRQNTLCQSKINPGRGGTHFADRKSTREVAEQTLPTRNWPGSWRNTLCRPEIDPGRGGTLSNDRKLTRDVAEDTLLTGNWPRTWRNTLCRPEIDPIFPLSAHTSLTFSDGEGLWAQSAKRFAILVYIKLILKENLSVIKISTWCNCKLKMNRQFWKKRLR